ncbi:Probable LIM domain-containing serine/threonine-protein kinase DDB [Seminavis robusta]|uniref:Probable LIM domain-containing serine/threonine-protein kinase DDB n=1 Tax=Seminavis robusta TaxID=568900 RepID=A0A9N8EPB2_9STRA|nr:Probable LIM domain-containing serine/threonine-protein kinase DDB [Seminavis robusta]|eukprot:Sro1442_g273040.1 Probable LIM domain-containing serine/threonine-protein kinase DDB (422) ;mRNA; r:8877-10142
MAKQRGIRRWARDSLRLTNPKNNGIANFSREEFTVLGVLGEGGFSTVYEVSHHAASCNTVESQEQRKNQEVQQCIYAMKVVREDLQDCKELMRKAYKDLVNEAKIMSKLDHPNILRLRGVPKCPGKCYGDFFIVADRLVCTLSERIQKWKAMAQSQEQLFPLKANYAFQLATALQHLHNHQIIYRDLKTENIGFKADDTVQLFDFGMARQLGGSPRRREWLRSSASFDSDSDSSAFSSDSQEEVFKMTRCGTQRYMPREALLGGLYSLKSDCYSFALVFWEMLTETKPFHYMTPAVHKILVCEKGERPPLAKHSFPFEIEDLLKRAWEDDISERLTMTQICDRLFLIVEDRPRKSSNNMTQDHCRNANTRVTVGLSMAVEVAIDAECTHEMSIEVTPTWLPSFVPFVPFDGVGELITPVIS